MADPFEVLEATWPAASKRNVGPWEIKEGAGGGKRVMAAKPVAPVTADDIAMAEEAMAELGQPSLFVLRPKEVELDSILAQSGYQIVDPTLLFTGPLDPDEVPTVTTFDIWPPLQIMRDLWAEQSVGPDRIAVMERAAEPKTSILGRVKDRAAGALFVSIHDHTAMAHAVAVLPDFRRLNLARNMMHAASAWALQNGATQMAVAVTDANDAAKALYRSLGMSEVGRYHYRIKP